MRILVINPNNWYNKGDVSNRLGLVKALKKEFGDDILITIETLTPKKDSQYFKRYGVDVVESIFCTDSVSPYILRIIKVAGNVILFLFSLAIYKIFKVNLTFKQKILDALTNADLIISSPGGFLQDYNVASALIPNLFLIFIAKIVNKPVIIYAQSVGPFRNRILRHIAKLIINRAEIIILREKISEKYVKDAGINRPKIFVTADATFSLNPPSYNREFYRHKLMKFFPSNDAQILIGVTTLGEYFQKRDRIKYVYGYVKSLSQTIDYLTEKLNAKVIFVPQVIAETERLITRLILGQVKNKDRVLVIEEDLSPEELMKLIGCMDLFIGTRTHSSIYALIMEVPVITIAYEHKAQGIMSMLGLSDWVLDIKRLNERELMLKINKLYSQRFEIKKMIAFKVREMRSKSLYTAKIIRKWLLMRGSHV